MTGARWRLPSDRSDPIHLSGDRPGMTLNLRERPGDTLLAASLLLLLGQPLWQLLEAPGRGRVLNWSVSVAAFLLLLAPGLIGRPLPRPHLSRAIIALLFFGIVGWAIGLPVPSGPGAWPTGMEISRVVMTRHLFAFEWSALLLAATWLCAPATSFAVEPTSAPVRSTSPARITKYALVVLVATLIAGLALVLAGRRAGIGPVMPSFALLLAATGLSTAALCQRLEDNPDA